MTKRITDIHRMSDEFASIGFEIAEAIHGILARKAYPIPDWFEDTHKSVAFDALEELIDRGARIEDHK